MNRTVRTKRRSFRLALVKGVWIRLAPQCRIRAGEVSVTHSTRTKRNANRKGERDVIAVRLSGQNAADAYLAYYAPIAYHLRYNAPGCVIAVASY